MAEPVPPGFRFHPTEEELLSYYLAKKVASEKFELDIIKEVDLNKLEPWDLQEKCRIGSTQQSDSYFFSHKDKKYPTGTRTNRATGAGFWKATGRDKAVSSNYTRIGMRKTLVFYRGRAPRGQKTDWIMHEYRLHVDGLIPSSTLTELEGWVVCHVFKKRNHRPKDEKVATATSVNNTPMNKPPLCKKEEEEEEREEEEEQEREEEEEQEEEEELEYKIEPQESYLHLPNLESPNCSGEDQGSKGNIEPFTIDLPEGSNSRPLFASYSSMHNHHEDLSLLTDWSLLESLTKEARFGPSFFTQIPSEIQPPTRFLPLEYVSACDLDLWSFPNTSIFM